MLWVKVILLFLLIPGIADVLVPWIILTKSGTLSMPAIGWLQVAGILVACAGLVIVIWVFQALARFGRGTPAPFDPPRQFVRRGLFRWVRNPLYLGAAVFIPLGEVLFFKSWQLLVYTVILFAILHLYVVLVEEKELERRFGRPYQKYLRTVPRWIPRRPHD
jgi:protein-S-isoprenylcysteine O-methyltransferase Ste14